MVPNQWFSIRGILPPEGYVVMSEDVFDDHNGGGGVGTTGIKYTRNTAKYSTTPGTAFHNK